MHSRAKQQMLLRDDVSRFVVHLTRDDRLDDKQHGATARKNFLSIMKTRKILALRPHCLHKDKVTSLPKKVRAMFDVACFTEVPLSQIRHLVGDIAGRRIKLEPYGLVFSKEFMISKGAQPAIYINCYGDGYPLRNAADGLFAQAEADDFESLTSYLLPFLNAMSDRYDFTWEREWRTQGDFEFQFRDLVCAVLPSEGDDEIREKLARRGIPAISPEWNYERIVAEFALQQRRTKQIISELKAEAPSTPKKKP